MNQQCILTVCTADHFQHYIPLFVRCVRRWGDGVDIRIYVRGALDDTTKRALSKLEEYGIMKGYDFIAEDYRTGLPFTVSATNCLRFLMCEPELMTYANILITDIDLLLFNDPFPWHIKLMDNTKQPFAGHHGPWSKPYRPEISKEGWRGAFERVAGGFFCIEPRTWYLATIEARRNQLDDLVRGYIGGWREADECMLGRIIKATGFDMPQQKGFPLELRGVHLGDFKNSMRHRFTNMAKMQKKLSDENCHNYIDIIRDKAWSEIERILREDDILAEILDRVMNHCLERGII